MGFLRQPNLREIWARGLCDSPATWVEEVRRRGSHIVMQKLLAGMTLTVPVPNHPEVRLGTLQSIIRQSGVPRAEFES